MRRKSRSRKTSAAAFAFALITCAGVSSGAHAEQLRGNPLLCKVIGPGPEFATSSLVESNVEWNDVAPFFSKEVICPLIETSTMPRDAVVDLGVHVEDNNPEKPACSEACRVSFSGNVASCGTPACTTTSGHSRLEPSLSAWNNSTGTAFIYVNLPVRLFLSLPEDSRFRGYFAST